MAKEKSEGNSLDSQNLTSLPYQFNVGRRAYPLTPALGVGLPGHPLPPLFIFTLFTYYFSPFVIFCLSLKNSPPFGWAGLVYVQLYIVREVHVLATMHPRKRQLIGVRLVPMEAVKVPSSARPDCLALLQLPSALL